MTLDLSTLAITDDQYEGPRMGQTSKYDDLFGRLQPGQRIVCPPGTTQRVSGALKKWLERHGHKDPVVRSRATYDERGGGVWWIADKPPARAKPQTRWVDVVDRETAAAVLEKHASKARRKSA